MECPSLRGTHLVYFCVAASALASFSVGYDVGIMSGAIVYMNNDLSLSQWDDEVIIASQALCSIFGALLGGHLAAILGRKRTIAFASCLLSIAVVITIATKHISIIVLGRILLGIATGVGVVVAPLYIAELAPHEIRGRLATVTEVSINTGIVSGYIVAWAFVFTENSDDQAWRLMIFLGCVPSLLLLLSLLVLPESPRWLVEQGRVEDAKQVLVRRSDVSDTENAVVTDKIQEIQKTIRLEQREGTASWRELLMPCIWKPSSIVQKALLVGCGVAFFQQACGIDAVTLYTPMIFQELGMSQEQILLWTSVVGLFKLFTIFVAMSLMDRIGRRKLLLISSFLLVPSLAAIVLSFILGRPPVLTVILQCLYVVSFSIGWGPCTWVIISEIFPLQIRSRAMGVATSVNRFVAGIVSLCFLSMEDALTPLGTWTIFLVFAFLGMVFVYTTVPETKNQSLEEITNSLIYGVGHSVSTFELTEDNIRTPLNPSNTNTTDGDYEVLA